MEVTMERMNAQAAREKSDDMISLETVLNLVRLQVRREQSTPIANALVAVATRVNAIMQTHPDLEVSCGQGQIDLAARIESVCRSLHAMAGAPQSLEIMVCVEPALMPARTAQRIVLAVNELVVNALRHAFPGDRKGVVTVLGYMSNGQWNLIVSDDGIGMVAGRDLHRGFGLRLARMMARRVGGVMTIEGSGGTRAHIVAPMPGYLQGGLSALPARMSASCESPMDWGDSARALAPQ